MAAPSPPPPDYAAQARSRLRLGPSSALALAVTAAVAYLVIHHLADPADFTAALSAAQPALLVAAAAVLAANISLASLRWGLIVRALGAPIPWRRGVRVILATWPVSVLTPSRAGDLLRAVATRDLLPVPEGMSAVVAEKLVDVQSLALLALVGGAAAGAPAVLYPALATLAAEWLAAWLILTRLDALLALGPVRRAPRLAPLLRRLFAAFHALRDHPRRFAAVAATSLLAWLLATSMVALLLHAYGATVPAAQLIARWPIAVFVGMLPLTLAGVGTRDAAFAALVASTAAPPDPGAVLAATFTYALLTTALPALAGLLPMLQFLRELGRPQPAPRPAPQGAPEAAAPAPTPASATKESRP